MSASTHLHDELFTSESRRLLNPVDRISEVLFGLLMAVTIVGSLSIATAGRDDVRTVLIAALGCNLAWGLVDAVMFLVRCVTEKTRRRSLVERVRQTDAPTAHRMIQVALPSEIAALLSSVEIEAMRSRLLASEDEPSALLCLDDWLSALGVFLLVVAATFPVILPFLLFQDLPSAMQASRWITLAMLFAAGHALGRYAGHPRPVVTGILMALVGAAVIVAIMALGG